MTTPAISCAGPSFTFAGVKGSFVLEYMMTLAAFGSEVTVVPQLCAHIQLSSVGNTKSIVTLNWNNVAKLPGLLTANGFGMNPTAMVVPGETIKVNLSSFYQFGGNHIVTIEIFTLKDLASYRAQRQLWAGRPIVDQRDGQVRKHGPDDDLWYVMDVYPDMPPLYFPNASRQFMTLRLP